MERHQLSKSTFIRSLQCHKSLYLYKNHYNLRDKITPQQQAIFDRGHEVGLLARKLFPGGKDASPPNVFKYAESVRKTKELIENGQKVIYEAAFQHERVLAAIDILVQDNGKWYAYEVKSSTSISATYYLDASLQYYIISNSGINLEDICIVHIDNTYIRNGEVEYEKLFNKVSVLQEAQKNLSFIAEKIHAAKGVINNRLMPEQPIGEHCFSPYNCDFMGHCWKNVPQNSVFDISGMAKVKQFELYNSGVTAVEDVPPGFELSETQKIQVECVKNGVSLINLPELKKFLKQVKYPVSLMDFETFMPAVPVYEGTRPFQTIPFQYSIHYLLSANEEPDHAEYLAEAGPDPRREFLEKLLSDTAKYSGSILAYNATFEKRVLKDLKEQFPDYADEIDERIARMVDLMEPFRNKYFYTPEMKGSYSIKNVLPALVPELSYTELVISNGNQAEAMFNKLRTETDIFNIAETRDALLEYCKLDTLAMVEILKVLEQTVRN